MLFWTAATKKLQFFLQTCNKTQFFCRFPTLFRNCQFSLESRCFFEDQNVAVVAKKTSTEFKGRQKMVDQILVDFFWAPAKFGRRLKLHLQPQNERFP